MAWGLYLLRVGAITSFLLSGQRIWLYWHQVVTGLDRARPAVRRAGLLAADPLAARGTWPLVLFPPVWSYVAIYRLDHFLWAAGPAVLFLSLATLWTGWVFFRYRRRVASSGATPPRGRVRALGPAPPRLPVPARARGPGRRGATTSTSCFALAVGAGILLLVLDDLRRGLSALSALSGDLQRAGREQDVLAALLARPLTLPAVRGSALYLVRGGPAAARARAPACASGRDRRSLDAAAAAVLARALETGRPQVTGDWREPGTPAFPYAAVLPLFRREEVIGALVLVGDARDPFTALDDRFLVALGQQVGAALENADLYTRLQARTVELARLSARMVEQHEEERRRLSRELHDETAQVFSAVKMELGVLRDGVGPDAGRRGSTRRSALIDTGIRSIRNVTNDLRPSLLDDLGLLPALRSLVADFGDAERHPRRARGARRPAAALQGGRAGPVPRAAGGAVERAAPRRCADAWTSASRSMPRRACGSRCATTAGALPAEPPSGSSARATWGWPACGSGSARSAAACGSAAAPARGASLEVAGAGRRRDRRDAVSDAAIRVLVADDHAIVRTGIRHVLESEPVRGRGRGVERRGGARPGARARARTWRCSISRCPACPASRRRRSCADALPDTRILILSMHDNTEYVLESLRAGRARLPAQGQRRRRARRRDPRRLPGRVVLQPAGGPPARRRGPRRDRRRAAPARWPSSPPASGRCSSASPAAGPTRRSPRSWASATARSRATARA